jgi:hypothetical protein
MFADNGKHVFVGAWVLTRAEFVRLVPEYHTPEGYTGREYVPGKVNRLWKHTKPTDLEGPWALGDWILANAASLRRRYATVQTDALRLVV